MKYIKTINGGYWKFSNRTKTLNFLEDICMNIAEFVYIKYDSINNTIVFIPLRRYNLTKDKNESI